MNKIKYTTALLLGGLLSFSSCTDNFADFNSTDGAYTEELQKVFTVYQLHICKNQLYISKINSRYKVKCKLHINC